jgi:hypothetical protein
MNEVTLDPDGAMVKAFISRAVVEQIDSPVQYAFNDGWPVHLSTLEAEELYQAVEQTEPLITMPQSHEHKDRALKNISEALSIEHQNKA